MIPCNLQVHSLHWQMVCFKFVYHSKICTFHCLKLAVAWFRVTSDSPAGLYTSYCYKFSAWNLHKIAKKMYKSLKISICIHCIEPSPSSLRASLSQPHFMIFICPLWSAARPGSHCGRNQSPSSSENNDPVHGSFINLMKLPNEGTLIFLVPASNHFMFWCRSCDERMPFMTDNDYKT